MRIAPNGQRLKVLGISVLAAILVFSVQFGSYRLLKTNPQQKIAEQNNAVQVIILSSARWVKQEREKKHSNLVYDCCLRSGSSFTGALLSSSSSASYIYEPLSIFDYSVSSAWEEDNPEKELYKSAEWLIRDTMECGIVSYFKKKIIRIGSRCFFFITREA